MSERCRQVHDTDKPCKEEPTFVVVWGWDGALSYPSCAIACPKHAYEVMKHVELGHWSNGAKPRYLLTGMLGER